jgi:hypothetical protein
MGKPVPFVTVIPHIKGHFYFFKFSPDLSLNKYLKQFQWKQEGINIGLNDLNRLHLHCIPLLTGNGGSP